MTSSADNEQKRCTIWRTCLSRFNRCCPVSAAPNPYAFPLQSPLKSSYRPQKQKQKHPRYDHMPHSSLNHRFSSVSKRDPLCYNDDEPLPLPAADHKSKDSFAEWQKVTIKAIPECRAVAASESVSHFTVLVGLKAPPLKDNARHAPVDIVTVLDVSGSMRGTKLELVKKAVHFVIANLGDSDRLSIVVFSDSARRILPLCRMTTSGRENAKHAADSLKADGGTKIGYGLKKGAQVLEQRRHKNPVTSILLLSDGKERSISSFPTNTSGSKQEAIPVHTFGFGSDHDPVKLHAIADASGGTFSFVETVDMIQDAFAGCIGGLLSVVAQEVRLKLRSVSRGVEIKLIPSGRCRSEVTKEIKSIPLGGYTSEITNQGSEGLINVGELYADEEKAFLINISIPVYENRGREGSERKTSLLDITCSYEDTISKGFVVIEGDLVEIRRPMVPSSQELAVNVEVDRQRNRLRAAESIKQAQQMAEAGNLPGAGKWLAEKRRDLMATAAAKAGDGMTQWLVGEMKETEKRMGSAKMYKQSGRAYALSVMSSHAAQRATTRGQMVAGAALVGGSPLALGGSGGGGSALALVRSGGAFGGYATPQMGTMVIKSRQYKAGEGNTSK